MYIHIYIRSYIYNNKIFSAEHINESNEALNEVSIRVLAEYVRTTCQILEVRIN